MKEPKLPRELNRACKLTEKDIENIFAMRAMDLTLQQIADEFEITKQAVYYVLKSSEEKKAINKKRHQRDTAEHIKVANEASRKARLYKRQVLKEEMKNAQKANTAEWRKKHPEYNKNAMSKHYYKEKIGDKWFGAVERKKYYENKK